jgi:Flp pilus assembly protein CpaB
MPSKLLTISLATGAVALIALRLHLNRLEARIAGGPVTRVLMLTADLDAGAALTRDAITTRELPETFRESRHIPASELEHVVGAQLAVAARANETLHWTDLASVRPKLRQLSSLIPRGMRAMTLAARNGSFDALLAPGDRVDILRSSGGRGEVVLQDVLVLAVGDDLGGPSAAGAASKARIRATSATVSVTLEHSRLLTQAEQLGALRFVVRNPDDVGLGSNASDAQRAEVTP